MRALAVYVAVAAIAALSAAGIAAGAAWDHTHPRPTPQSEWVSDWYCTYRHVRCDDTKPWAEGWHAREPVYDYAFASSLTIAALFGLAAASRRRRLQSPEWPATRSSPTMSSRSMPPTPPAR